MRTRILHGAALAVFLLALAASACSSPLGSCGLIIVQTSPADTVRVQVGADAPASARTLSGCPETIAPPVTFQSGDTTIATVRAVNDTAAVVHGVKAGQAVLIAQSRDRTNIRTGIPIKVTGP